MVAPPFEPVPPPRYGGTELVVSNLTEQLVARGHEVALFASGDSTTRARLHPIATRSLAQDPSLRHGRKRELANFFSVAEAVTALSRGSFDIIHTHHAWWLLPFRSVLPCPLVTTLHNLLDVKQEQDCYRRCREANFVSISDSQRHGLPELNYVATVYNGIDLTKFHYFPKAEDYFAVLARITPGKGITEAIQIAKQAGVRLKIAGKIDPGDRMYFTKLVKPMIDGDQIQYIGEVDHDGKLALLGNARALIAPIQWEEPFGLFFVEALACGTPVLATPRGSVPEIIEDGVTGLVRSTVEELAQAAKRVDTLDRKVIFDFMHTGKKFAAETMAQNYLKVYQSLL